MCRNTTSNNCSGTRCRVCPLNLASRFCTWNTIVSRRIETAKNSPSDGPRANGRSYDGMDSPNVTEKHSHAPPEEFLQMYIRFSTTFADRTKLPERGVHISGAACHRQRMCGRRSANNGPHRDRKDTLRLSLTVSGHTTSTGSAAQPFCRIDKT